ncbi:hypothetical protein Hanom_Chr08g00714541 [Helianthus anomalus]
MFEKFNVFYFVTYTGGFYSFNSRTGGGVPWVNVSISYTKQDWYTTLTRKVTLTVQLEERALVAAGMSMLWAPQNPKGFPDYGYKGKEGYSLMNIFYPKAGGAMVVAVLPEGRPLWVDQIRDNFLYPSSESMATYAIVVLGNDGEDETDVDPTPTQEEPILLSSGESTGSYQDLIHCFARAGPQRGAAQEPAVEGVDTPVVDLQAGAAEQVETRKKKKEEKTEGKKAEEPVTETPRTRPSNSFFLDYVVVSDTLSGLDAGIKRQSLDPNDDATLAEMMKKRKKTGNRLEKIFKSFSAPRASSKSAHFGPKIDISKITLAASPPSKHLDLSPLHPDPKGNGKEDDVEVDQTERVVENIAVGSGRDEVHAEGVETEYESSVATHQDTVYTKRVRGS